MSDLDLYENASDLRSALASAYNYYVEKKKKESGLFFHPVASFEGIAMFVSDFLLSAVSDNVLGSNAADLFSKHVKNYFNGKVDEVTQPNKETQE